MKMTIILVAALILLTVGLTHMGQVWKYRQPVLTQKMTEIPISDYDRLKAGQEIKLGWQYFYRVTYRETKWSSWFVINTKRDTLSKEIWSKQIDNR